MFTLKVVANHVEYLSNRLNYKMFIHTYMYRKTTHVGKYEEGERNMKKRRGNILAGILAIVMLMTTVLSLSLIHI